MSTARSMARNAGTMMISQVMTWTATLVLMIYLPRMLGAAGYGKLQFISSLAGMFAIVVDFGTSRLVTRAVARDHSRAAAYLANTVVLKLVTVLLAYVGFIASIVLTRHSDELTQWAYILGISMVMLSLTATLYGFLQGFEEMHYQAWGMVIDKVISTSLIVVALRHGYGLTGVVWIIAGIAILDLAWAAYWVARLVRPERHLLKLSFMRDLVVESLPFFMFAVFARVYDKIDITMLGMMTSDRVVGWYGAAYSLMQSLFFLPYIFQTVVLPVMSRLWVSNLPAYRHAVHRGMALLCTAAVGVSVSTILLAGRAIEILYPHREFSGTVPALRVLALALLSMYINAIFVTVLLTTDREKRWARAGAFAAVLNPAANLLMIPWLGHIGAAITTVLTEVTLLLLAWQGCPAGIFDRSDLGTVLRSLLAGGALAAGLILGLHWGLLPALALGVPAYLAAIISLRVLTPADLSAIREAFVARLGASKGLGRDEAAA